MLNSTRLLVIIRSLSDAQMQRFSESPKNIHNFLDDPFEAHITEVHRQLTALAADLHDQEESIR